MNIKLKDFVTSEAKVDLVGLSIKESTYDNIINPMLLKIFLDVNIILNYSDYTPSEKDLEDKLALYDKFIKENIKAVDLIGLAEYKSIECQCREWVSAARKYNYSVLGLMESISSFAEILQKATEENVNFLQNADLSDNKYKNVLDIAQALGKQPID